MTRIAFLGPPGTNSEEALLSDAELAAATHVACASIPEVVQCVEAGRAELGIVPFENAIEGAVTVALDTLAFESDLLIRQELVRPIAFNLIARPGTSLADVSTVVSFPYATAQCRGWLARTLPGATVEAATSTASAVERVARSRSRGLAAIGARLAADLHRLEVVAAGIEDHPDNATRFVVVGRGVPAPTGHDKTTVVVFQREDRPGSLLGILQEFAARSVNLTRLESRPAKTGLGRYCFAVDLEGHVADELVADALRNVHAKHGRVKFLGSYPVHGEAAPERRRAAGKAWREAVAWLDGVRGGIDPA
ncbi:MAG: prephenate dehydratase [Thermoleophilia bacterium]